MILRKPSLSASDELAAAAGGCSGERDCEAVAVVAVEACSEDGLPWLKNLEKRDDLPIGGRLAAAGTADTSRSTRDGFGDVPEPHMPNTGRSPLLEEDGEVGSSVTPAFRFSSAFIWAFQASNSSAECAETPVGITLSADASNMSSEVSSHSGSLSSSRLLLLLYRWFCFRS